MEGYLGEIRFFAGTFEPKGWMFCKGQLLNIAAYTALFRIIGPVFGGDGRTNFKLPDLQIRAAVGTGQGPATSRYHLADTAGSEVIVLYEGDIPSHTHNAKLFASNRGPNQNRPGRNYLAKGSRTTPMPNIYTSASNPMAAMRPSATLVESNGSSAEYDNMQPFLACNFIICVEGIHPS